MRTVPSAELTCSTTPVAANTRSLASSASAPGESNQPESARQINNPHNRIFLTVRKSPEVQSRTGQQTDAVEPGIVRCVWIIEENRASRRHVGVEGCPIH